MPSLRQVRVDNPGNFDASGTDGDFSQMFANSPQLQNLDLSVWKATARPKKMAMMFMGDTALTDVDLSGWDTSAVTDMSSMFRGDTALRAVNVSGWNVSSVTDMSGMFLNDAALTSIPGLQAWAHLGASAPTVSLCQMFSGAASLTSLDLSAWKASNVINMSGMFYGASSLSSLNLSNWNTSRVRDMSNLFALDASLRAIDGLAGWNTSGVEFMQGMFSMVKQVPDLPLPGTPDASKQAGPSDLSAISGWDVRRVRTFNQMFMGLNRLPVLNLSNWKTLSANSMQAMFAGCTKLSDIKGVDKANRDWSTGRVTDMSYMFYLDGVLARLGDLSNWKTAKVQNMEGMFRYDESLSGVSGMKNWKTDQVTSMAGMFQRNRARTDLKDVSVWKTPKVTAMWDMFGGDSNLTSLDLSGWDTSKVTSMTYMFQGTGITSLDLSNWDTTNVRAGTNARACAEGTVKADAGTCRVLPEYLNELTVGGKTKLTPEFFSSEPLKNKGYTGRWARNDDKWTSDDSAGANEQLAARCPGSGSVGQDIQTYLWQQTATVNFDANLPESGLQLSGGSLPSAIAVTGADVSRAEQTVPESALAANGYRFTGWNTVWNGGNDLNGKPGKAYKAGDQLKLNRGDVITLYAQWQSTGGASGSGSEPVDNQRYTVRYLPNEPDGFKANGSMPDDTFTANAAASSAYKRALAESGYTLEGYTFQGWSRVPSSSSAWRPGVELNMQPGINTMYAQWTKNGAGTAEGNGNISGNGEEGTDEEGSDGQGITVIVQPATLPGAPQLGAAPTPVTGTANSATRAPGASNNANNGQQNRDSTTDAPQNTPTVPRCVERSTGEVRNSASGISYVTPASTLPYCDNDSGGTPKKSANPASAKTSVLPSWWWLVVLCVTAAALGAIALRQRSASHAMAASQHRKRGR